MNFNPIKFAAIVAAAKAKTANNAKWIRAIDRAAAALLSGELIVTLIDARSLVTSANGSYWVNGACQCKAAQAGHKECYHRAGVRLVEMYEDAIYALKTEMKPEPKPERKPTAPRITRSVERNYNGPRFQTVRIDGWYV